MINDILSDDQICFIGAEFACWNSLEYFHALQFSIWLGTLIKLHTSKWIITFVQYFIVNGNFPNVIQAC